jgi:hypothetical protein
MFKVPNARAARSAALRRRRRRTPSTKRSDAGRVDGITFSTAISLASDFLVLA